MTEYQVFKWFCKEQKITHYISHMFYKTQPTKTVWENNQIVSKYIDFETYVVSLIKNFGFNYLLDNIIDNYAKKLRKEYPYDAYWQKRKEIHDKFNKYCLKWRYFTQNNILIDPNMISVGKVVNYMGYDNKQINIKVSSIDIPRCEIYGLDVNNGSQRFVNTYRLMDKYNRENLKINYIIKRKKKIYHGANSK